MALMSYTTKQTTLNVRSTIFGQIRDTDLIKVLGLYLVPGATHAARLLAFLHEQQLVDDHIVRIDVTLS